MGVYTIVRANREVENTKRKVSTSLNALLTGFINDKNIMFIGERLYALGWGDMFRLLVEGLDDCPLAYRNLILNSVYRINEECPLAVPTYLITLQKLLQTPFSESIIEKIEKSILEKRAPIRRVSSKEAINIWRNTLNDNSLDPYFDHIKDAIYQAGSLGTIDIKKSERFPFVNTSDGLTIAADIHPIFISQVGKGISIKDCGVVIVDGAILEISEIHHILTRAHEDKKAIAIIASQIHDEIANTLAVNWKQGKLRVIPVSLKANLEDLNQIKDISEIIGCSPITKDTGQRLSNIEFGEIVDTLGITPIPEKQEVKISLYSNRMPAVILQRKRIHEQIKKEKTQDIVDVMKKRLSRLSCRSVELGIPCHRDEEGILKDRIGGLLLFMSSAAAQGLTKTEKIYDILEVKSAHKTSLPAGLPSHVTNTALKRAISDFQTINKIKAIVALDDE